MLSCTPVFNDQPVVSTPGAAISKTPAEAIKSSIPVIIPPGDTLSSELTKADPVIIPGGKNNHQSNYKLFQLEAKENEIYLVELFSCPDHQHVLFPTLAIADKDGNVLQHNKIVQYGVMPAAGRNNSCIYCLQEVYTAETGSYYIIVMSDNSFGKGIKVTTPFREPPFTFKLKGIAGMRSPWGNFRICIRKK